MTQGMTVTNQSSERRLTCKWLCLLRTSLRPRQVHACPPRELWSRGTREKVRSAGTQEALRDGEGGNEISCYPIPLFPRDSKPSLVHPSLLFGNHFILLLFEAVARFIPLFISQSRARLFAFFFRASSRSPLFLPATRRSAWSRLIVSFEMLHSSCLLSTLF